MRRAVTLLLAVLLLIGLSPVVFATNDEDVTWRDVNETVYATAGVNVRSGPGTNHKQIGSLDRGDSVHRTAVGSNGWSKVEYQGKEAYIASSYLSKTKPGTSGSVDYDDLTKQVAIANGLKEQDYTKESWAAMLEALEDGESALRSKKQSKVDSAYYALESAIAGLVPMDYTQLWEILRKVEGLNEPEETYDLWAELVLAVENGRELLSSGDQTAVDEGVAQINGILEKVKAYLDAQEEPQIVTKEVQVEVPPSDDYCNIAGHRIWPVLFFVSLVLNAALVVVVVSILRKKQKQADDTPLVDYDIDDDIYEI